MHPNLALFMRDSSPGSSTSPDERLASPERRRDVAERCELPVSFSISSPTRWDHDILGDQHRMLGPKTGWGIGSPPSLGMPTFTSPSSPCFTPGCLPGPIIVDDEDETEDDDLWLAPMADFQAPSSDLPWHLSPSPDTSSGTSLSSLFAATATTTTTATALPSSSPPMDSSRPCDRRTLELIHFFFNILSPCLLSSSSPTEADNPWRRLILPLTYGSEPLRSAVCAISSAHLETIGAVSSRASGGYRERAVEELAKLMEEKLGSVATSLSTTLLLIHYDSMTGKGMTSIQAHIQAAHRLLSLPRDKEDQALPFLEKIFHLYDVSAALSQGSEPIAHAHSWNNITSVADRQSTSPSSLFSASISSADLSVSPIDPVFGLGLSLWPTLHRLASLRSLTEELQASITSSHHTLRIAVLHAEHESATRAIDTALNQWYPLQRTANHPDPHRASSTSSLNFFDDEPVSSGRPLTAQTAISYHHAMSFRASALVYLHRAIRRISASHDLVRDSALASINHCIAAMQQGSSRLPLWPPFIAACNLEKGHDRLLATQMFQLMGRTPQTTAGKHLWHVVASVWRRLDAFDDESEEFDFFTVWRDVGQSMGLTVFLD